MRLVDSPAARARLPAVDRPNGRLSKPLITVHNQYDSEVPFQMESQYQALAQAAGQSGKLQIRTSQNAYGHCNFTQTDMSNALFQLFWAVDDWGGILGAPAERGSQTIPMAAGPR